MNYTEVSVPVSTQAVRMFINDSSQQLETTLKTVREMIEWAVRGENVVKLYGREDRQGGNKYKDVRKIATKFNSYHHSKKNKKGSLWDVPDIIGFTVVVSYPSDVARIAEIIDGLVQNKFLKAVNSGSPTTDDRNRAPIEFNPSHGRVLADRGYFACHYNVQANDYGDLPICEIQIKTAMHDAWGMKTHDLVYKTPAPFDPNLLKNFEALGEVLSHIDWQSDFLRGTLSNVARVRSSKKQSINSAVMDELFDAAMSSIEKEASKGKKPSTLRSDLGEISIHSEKSKVLSLESQIISLHDAKSVHYSFEAYAPYLAHFFLARNANDIVAQKKAEKGLSLWVNRIDDPFEQSYALANVGLFKFYNDNRLDAIEETEAAILALSKTPPPRRNTRKYERYWRRMNSIHISLAYYYAEMIGTHDGQVSNAEENAQKNLALSLKTREHISGCASSVDASDIEIERSISIEPVKACILEGYSQNGATITDENLLKEAQREAESNYNTLSCEIFVRSQLAKTVTEVEVFRNKLALIYKNPPASNAALADSLLNFHDYCIRQRLAELE